MHKYSTLNTGHKQIINDRINPIRTYLTTTEWFFNVGRGVHKYWLFYHKDIIIYINLICFNTIFTSFQNNYDI